MNIKILYEDKNILAIDKPVGVAVHSDGKSKEKTPNQNKFGTGQAITDWVLKKYPKLRGIGEPITFDQTEIDRPGIVHRLDKETSGVLLIMKNQEAFAYFKKQFMDRKVQKTYLAFINGWPKNDHGIINKPIGRSPTDFRRRLAGRGARGEMREAVTEYKILKRFLDTNGNKFSYLEVHPKTGRTHQIRVHLKFLNYPIVGDTLYNPKGPKIKGFNRMALHAKCIEFKDLKGKIIKIESPLPKEFESILKEA